jgi:hypothetical protein
MREFSELSIAVVIALCVLSAVYAAKEFFVSTSLSPQTLKSAPHHAVGSETLSRWPPPMPPAAPILARRPVHQECDVGPMFRQSLRFNASEASAAPCSTEKPDE